MSDLKSLLAAATPPVEVVSSAEHTRCIQNRYELANMLIEAAPLVLELITAEREYRRLHDFAGDGALTTGRAWDRMRKASNALAAKLGVEE